MNRQYDQIFGGVEYMSTSLANNMSTRGNTCHLLSLDMDGADIEYDLDPSIAWHKVSMVTAQNKAGWKERLGRLQRIRRILKDKKIDIGIGFQDGAFLTLALAALGTGIPIIAAERNSPTRFDYTSEGKKRNLRYRSFQLAKYITVQCASYVDLYPSYLRPHIKIIPNPVPPTKNQAAPEGKKNDRKILLSVGRLSYQKNYMILLQAFADIAKSFPLWDMVIVGEGDHRKRMEEFIKQHNLETRITLTGYTKDTQSYYNSAHLFCLPSLWEGFPNALAEAMAHGLPSVGFVDCAGVSDLIESQKTGLLAEGNGNPESLSHALSELMDNDNARLIMGKAAKERTKEFTPEQVYDKWEQLFINATQG